VTDHDAHDVHDAHDDHGPCGDDDHGHGHDHDHGDAFHYLVHGLVVTSPVELPIPACEPCRADVVYRLERTVREIPPARHVRSDDVDDPWVTEHWTDDGLIVDFPGWATFEVARERVALIADDTDDPDLVAHLLLDHVLPRLVALRGDLMLHAAGAVGPSGRAHVFLGPTGTGKSTLATAMAAAGWPLLDDDGLRVVATDGVWCVVPGYAGVRLLPDSAEAVVPLLPPGRPMAKGHDKRRYAVDGTTLTMANGPVPIGVVYVLERVDAHTPDTSPLGFGDRLTALVEHGFHLADEPAAITRQAFERAAAVAADADVRRLGVPLGLESLAATVALLGDIDAEFS
jgi:hypothetical protein